MTALDTAVAELQALLQQMQDITAADVANLWAILAADLTGWEPGEKRAIIAALQDQLANLVIAGNAAVVADTTAGWYDLLAPEEKYTATVPPEDIITNERIAASISWAVNTATTAETALTQLQGTVQRAVLDAQRETVSYNANREGVRYRRHCGYAACNWCLVMASRGAVYKSATSAVRGHDNCRCLAVPERPGMTDYTVPPLVREAEQKYVEARKQLEAEGMVGPSLDTIIGRMDAADVKAVRDVSERS
jgi:ferredoxin